jgi:hypothetical protein
MLTPIQHWVSTRQSPFQTTFCGGTLSNERTRAELGAGARLPLDYVELRLSARAESLSRPGVQELLHELLRQRLIDREVQ